MADYPQTLDREQIKQLIPHRDPFLLTDRVLEWTETTIHTQFDVTPDLPVFAGHFPNNPIFPGVMMVESVAQAGALLGALTLGLEDDTFIAFSGVDKARFAKPVLPGDTLDIRVSIEKTRLPFVWFAGEAKVGDRRACSLLFSAAKMTYQDV